jgi:hypothetical protein
MSMLKSDLGHGTNTDVLLLRQGEGNVSDHQQQRLEEEAAPTASEPQRPTPLEGAPSTTAVGLNHWSKDVSETGLWGIRNRKEVYICIAIVLLMIGATATGVILAVQNSNSTELEGKTKVDPTTGETISAYELPVRPDATIVSDEEELAMILRELTNHDVLSELASSIPNTVTALSSAAASSTDPYTLAADWLTSADTSNGMEYAVTRFALAVMYYSTGGKTWSTSTNWLSTEYHCNWHGVQCCENLRGSLMCQSDDFGRVLEVDLFRNNLIGTIPASMALLPYLQSLYLSENSLGGTIPGLALGSLKNFSKLYASYNFLTGTIPVELDNNGLFSK